MSRRISSVVLLLSLAACGIGDKGGTEPTPVPQPKIVISGPAAGAVIAKPDSIVYTASSGTAPLTTSVSFNDSVVSTGSSPFRFDPKAFKNGAYKVKASVKDAKGLAASDSVSITIANPPPQLVLTITSPASGATVSDTQKIAFTVSGGTPPYTSTASVDNGAAAVTASPYSFITNVVGAGAHTVAISVSDAGTPKQTVSSTLPLTVSNLLTPDSSFVTAPVSTSMVLFCAPSSFIRTGGTSGTNSQVGFGQQQAKTRSGGGKSAQYCPGASRDSGFVFMFVGKSITDVFSKQAADTLRLSASIVFSTGASGADSLYVQRFDGTPASKSSTILSLGYDRLVSNPSSGLLPAPVLAAVPAAGTTGYYNGMLFGKKWRCTGSGVFTVSVNIFSLFYFYKDKTTATEASDPFVLTITCP